MNNPNPLSLEVQERAKASEVNIHLASKLLGVEQTPTSELPAWLRDEAIAKAKAKEMVDTAEASTVAKFRAFDQYQAAIAEARSINNDMTHGVEVERQATALLQRKQEIFNEWPRYFRENKWHVVHGTLLDMAAAEKLVDLMPASLEMLRAKLAKVNNEIAGAEAEFGFTKE